ncbi:MAG: hypothetical protein CFE35_14185 [Novosphingobium sp. PASSN1]|nr:MAG: hypothetical protein CFE35_14185 [Novosphingobium sp. PASSN1]
MTPTDTAIRNAKPQAKPYKLADEKGLFLLVQPSGGKLWRFKFRVDGRDESGQPKRVEKKVAFGAYPDVNLKDARRLRDEARTTLVAERATLVRTIGQHHWPARAQSVIAPATMAHAQPSPAARATAAAARRHPAVSARNGSPCGSHQPMHTPDARSPRDAPGHGRRLPAWRRALPFF